MGSEVSEVRWTATAVAALESIYAYYSEESVQAAANVVSHIIETAESILFTEQYQQDEINHVYRRMVAGHYKILYTISENKVFIANIVDTRAKPGKY